MLTKIYHVNVDAKGKSCAVDCSIEDWSPAYTFEKLLLKFYDVLINPDLEHSCCNYEINSVFQKDTELYKKNAIEWTQKYAM